MAGLKSESVVIESPMSFTGSAKRIWKLTQIGNALLKWCLLVWVALALIAMAWCIIIFWYILFGLLVVPWRLFRRSGRKAKRDKLRHRELLDTIERQNKPAA